MVQKDSFSVKTFIRGKILFLLIIFSVPFPVDSGNQIPIRKNCSLITKKQVYDYYDRQSAHDFGRKIQNLVANKDLEGIYKNVLKEELINGPRRAYVKNKTFDQIFPKEWINKITSSEIGCDSRGWRGFMISDGLIWYDKNVKGDWSIVSINGVGQENFQNESLIGWETKRGIIPPTCFPTFSNFETPKIDLFSRKFDIKNKKDFKYNPGKYIGNPIPINHSIKSKINEDSLYVLTTYLEECFKWDLANGFLKGKEKNKDLVLVNKTIYQKNSFQKKNEHNLFKTHYKVLSKIKLSKCDKLATQLSSRCKESFLILIGSHSGGSIGWVGSYYIFGIFEDENKKEFLVPLKMFDNKNLALNELNK